MQSKRHWKPCWSNHKLSIITYNYNSVVESCNWRCWRLLDRITIPLFAVIVLTLRVLTLLRNHTSTVRSTLKSSSRAGREEFSLSLIPLHESLGLRVYSPLLESFLLIIPSKSCRQLPTVQIFAFLRLLHAFTSFLHLSLFLYIYVYSLSACQPFSDSSLCLCPTLFISACLCILVSLSDSLPSSASSSSLSVLCSPVQSPVDIMRLTSQSGSRRERLLPVHRYCQASEGFMYNSVHTPKNFSTSSLYLSTTTPEVSQ